jgi:hypothetical protein
MMGSMSEIEQATRRFAQEHAELVPVLQTMLSAAAENAADPSSGLGEFSRDWIAARDPRTPRTPHTLSAFVKAGLIQPSPRGSGSGRIFYVLTDRAAVERALITTGH